MEREWRAGRKGDEKIYSKHHCQIPHFSGQNGRKNVWRLYSTRTRWMSLTAPRSKKGKGGGREGEYRKYIQNITA
jgi:hypothetical protein